MGGFLCPLPVCAPCAAGLRACSIFNFFAFAFSCLTFASQNSFHLSLRPRRASTFFRKESRQRFAKGLRPFEPHSCALRPIFSSSALLAGLTALRAANRRLIRETPEKPRSRAQLFGRFCALGMRRGFCPAWENRSHTRARTRKQPRACEAEQRHKLGARLAHRRWDIILEKQQKSIKR